MEKRWMGVIAGAMCALLVVYVDMVLWTNFGSVSVYQQFPIIYLIAIPFMLILVSLLWGKLPSAE